MTYVQGFVTAVPIARREAYMAHAEAVTGMFAEFGATRVVEAWGDDLPVGKTNDFGTAVLRGEDETTVFSWIEFSDLEIARAAFGRLMRDPRMAAMEAPPFDASRVVYGGFDCGLDVGVEGRAGYVDGFLIPVPAGHREAYFAMAETAASVFLEHGATRVVEGWGIDVPHGRTTDFHRAVLATADETVVFSWVEWPDKATRESGVAAVTADPRMQPSPGAMPFDGTRAVFGGFEVVLDRRFADAPQGANA